MWRFFSSVHSLARTGLFDPQLSCVLPEWHCNKENISWPSFLLRPSGVGLLEAFLYDMYVPSRRWGGFSSQQKFKFRSFLSTYLCSCMSFWLSTVKVSISFCNFCKISSSKLLSVSNKLVVSLSVCRRHYYTSTRVQDFLEGFSRKSIKPRHCPPW